MTRAFEGELHRDNLVLVAAFASRRRAAPEECMKTWLNVVEAAEYSGVSRDTIYTACERGELRHARIGGRRAIRIKPIWIDEWLERHARGAQECHTSSAP